MWSRKAIVSGFAVVPLLAASQGSVPPPPPQVGPPPPIRAQGDLAWVMAKIRTDAGTVGWKDCRFRGPNAFLGDPANPKFSFNGDTSGRDFNCYQSGPYERHGRQWFIQFVNNIRPTGAAGQRLCYNGWPTCKTSVIRVCSISLVGKPGSVGLCKAKGGVGDGGCEVCAGVERPPGT